MSKRKTLAQWREHLEAAVRADVPLAQYARSQDFKVQRLYSARHQLKRDVPVLPSKKARVVRAKFVPVHRLEPSGSGMTARLPNGVIVEFVGVDATALSGVLSSLARLSCSG